MGISLLMPALLAATLPWAAAAPTTAAGDRLGAVASENKVCSEVGAQLLKDGGNAADAMIGTVLCVGVTNMYHSGIGGGGFGILRTSNGSYEAIDFRETAPAAAYENMFANNTDASLYGGLASGIPGELRGLERIHKHAVLPWAHDVAPAIKLARYGFEVNADLVRYIASVDDSSFLVEDPSWAIDFAPNGTLVGLGDTLTRKRYADTLETIAKEGVDAFYTGPIANATITALRQHKGNMVLEDLANYTVALRKPAQIKYHDHLATATNAPSGGVVALSALNILSGYDNLGDPAAVNISTHYLDEALRFAYGQRANLGDPSFVDGLDEYLAEMLDPKTGAEIRSKISDDHTYPVAYYDPEGLESIETPGTSHIVTADASGMSLSLTTTVNLLFGSRVVVPETGVIMNDEMNDFSIPGVSNAFGYIPSEANFIRPGKRPLSSISPVILESPEGELYFSIGAAGGSRITTATVQNILHVIDGDLTVAEALAKPRLHDQLSPSQVEFEYSYDNSTVAFLKSLGANVTWTAPGKSTAQGLRRLKGGVFEAAGEPRQLNSGGVTV
ncbi:gamma-glutamyltranspeptidase / glutathione hydrolase [Geosmithia morbida]|uniref:Glutathione hydrolase n=1 Tax=Geosmithia morbida TaxID=1094350 RepID=A0A9P4YS97_9HYPO|nr:gamma-glutamyltranspeptidase / glutathione hydrolase [Geosmithia morbida]KAF4120059.1 gamma-glutamyltranspeptidase / glutathione hydrolase [Geosmithia morbida]